MLTLARTDLDITKTLCAGASLLALAAACGPVETDVTHADDEGATAVANLALDAAQTRAILAVVNDPTNDFATLDDVVRLDKRAARNIVEHRDGPDGRSGTRDDRLFTSIEELDAIPYVGAKALGLIRDHAIEIGLLRAPAPLVPSRPGIRFSATVFLDVLGDHGLTDAENLLERAIQTEDGNNYLNRAELTHAAKLLVDDLATLRGYTYSDSVVRSVLTLFELNDRLALLVEATKQDSDGNAYLKRSEIERAAHVLGGMRAEIGIISDIDRTLLPPHRGSTTLPAPYPGVTTMLHILEHGNGGEAGDTFYVTARSADRIDGLAEWMQANRLPRGPIEPGVSPEPWVAEPEKIADIERVLSACPTQKFILLGDSNHRDPEVFRTLIQRHPTQIAAALIHKVNNVNPTRVAGLMTYENYAEAAAALLRLGLLDEAQARSTIRHAQFEGLRIDDAEVERLIAANANMN